MTGSQGGIKNVRRRLLYPTDKTKQPLTFLTAKRPDKEARDAEVSVDWRTEEARKKKILKQNLREAVEKRTQTGERERNTRGRRQQEAAEVKRQEMEDLEKNGKTLGRCGNNLGTRR